MKELCKLYVSLHTRKWRKVGRLDICQNHGEPGWVHVQLYVSTAIIRRAELDRKSRGNERNDFERLWEGQVLPATVVLAPKNKGLC